MKSIIRFIRDKFMVKPNDPVSLESPKVFPLSQKIARELKLDPKLIEFVFSENRPSCCEYWVDTQNIGWTCNVPEEVKVTYRLWSTNADDTLICISDNKSWFMQGFHDDPEAKFIANTVQGLWVDLFIDLYESEASFEEINKTADLVGFKYLSEVIEFEEKCSQNFYEEKKKLIELIDNESSARIE